MSLTAGGGIANPAVQAAVITLAGTGYSLAAGANLVQTIFDNGRRRAVTVESAAREEELLAAYRGAVLSALVDVENALTGLTHLDQQGKPLHENVVQSERAFEGSQLRYREGSSEYLTLLDSQRTLYSARDSECQYRLARLQGVLGLNKALGGGWQSARRGAARAGGLAMRMSTVTLLLACALTLNACQRNAEVAAQAKDEPAKEQAASPRESEEGLQLSAEESAKLGIAQTPAPAAHYVGEVEGFATVISPDIIAQAQSERVTAEAAARQSHAALSRVQRLAGTAGADSATVREGAERQVAADDAAVDLADAKAAAVLGRGSPWHDAAGSSLLKSLRAGRIKVIRLSFPLGTFTRGNPQQARVSRIDQSADKAWRLALLWPAPADAVMPGRSFLGVVEKSDLADGERLLAWATDLEAPNSLSGVFVPASALIVSADRYWCYIERKSGSFVRVRIDINRPQPGGYFVAEGIKPGDGIVTSGAGLLLARETNAGGDADP